MLQWWVDTTPSHADGPAREWCGILAPIVMHMMPIGVTLSPKMLPFPRAFFALAGGPRNNQDAEVFQRNNLDLLGY